MAGTVVGQPPRKRLRVDDDPFGAVGDYAGSFLIKSAVELSRRLRHQSRRGSSVPRASPFYVIAPEFVAFSDWERHALVADLSGSFTGYSNNLHAERRRRGARRRRRISTGRISSAMSMAVSTSAATPGCSAQARLRVATDNPGSPNVQAGLSRYPVYATFGGTFGVDQNFNRLQVSAGATVDRTDYTILEAHRRHLDQQRRPQLQPVRRRRPRQLRFDAGPEAVRAKCRATSACTTSGSTATAMRAIPAAATSRAGTSFEFSRLLTGEIAVGWAARDLCRSAAAIAAGPARHRPRWCGPRRR